MNTNPQTAFRPVDYEGANQHPDFLCPRCQHGYLQGDGGEYLGMCEFHYLACQRFTRYDPRRIVDAELHGPFGLGVDLTMIVVECDQFALDPTRTHGGVHDTRKRPSLSRPNYVTHDIVGPTSRPHERIEP